MRIQSSYYDVRILIFYCKIIDFYLRISNEFCIFVLSEEMTKGDAENLEKSRENENLKTNETRNFIKGLESQNKI